MNTDTCSVESRVSSSAGMDCIDILISDIVDSAAEHMTDLERVTRIHIPAYTVLKTDIFGKS